MTKFDKPYLILYPPMTAVLLNKSWDNVATVEEVNALTAEWKGVQEDMLPVVIHIPVPITA
ncbi:hypothetical protein [Anaeroselena agilis]|uniref:Uncharacterized protein n=1 Tax=Anaeroselena agilis TaxID=3063788 RepID=A0ABU3NVR9_9FIRM|nr:hypothetical protein [Selenomonadales bacterium 4137-cl]